MEAILDVWAIATASWGTEGNACNQEHNRGDADDKDCTWCDTIKVSEREVNHCTQTDLKSNLIKEPQLEVSPEWFIPFALTLTAALDEADIFEHDEKPNHEDYRGQTNHHKQVADKTVMVAGFFDLTWVEFVLAATHCIVVIFIGATQHALWCTLCPVEVQA